MSANTYSQCSLLGSITLNCMTSKKKKRKRKEYPFYLSLQYERLGVKRQFSPTLKVMYFKCNPSVQLLLLYLSLEGLSCAEERCKDVGCMLIPFKMPSFLSTQGRFPHCHLLDKCLTVFYFNTLQVQGVLLDSIGLILKMEPKQTGTCKREWWH